VGAVLGQARFEPGRERLLDASFSFDDSDLPRFGVTIPAAPADGPEIPGFLEALLTDALLQARDCLPATVRSGTLPRLFLWKVDHAKRSIETSWVEGPGDAFSESALACVTSRVTGLTWPRGGDDDDASGVSVGVATVEVVAPEKYEAQRPQDTVMVGYEFQVTARRGKDVIGATRLRMTPGAVPPLRLRASEQIVDPGATVTIELLRGPDFVGELPKSLWLRHAYRSVEAKVDPETGRARAVVPADWQGWADVEGGNAKVFLFVRSKTPLSVELKAEQVSYAPGQIAHLAVDTSVGGAPGQAAVGLIGVDESLGQLVPLPGADELSKLQPRPTASAPFGGIDVEALALGRVRGANAAAATLVRVSLLPPPPELEAAVTIRGQTELDPNAILVDRFYVVLGALANEVRTWETGAPAGTKMTPSTMANLWSLALDAVEQRKESASDAWGRRLRLHRLPADLLALTDPRALVINGTRLPEDVQNWAQWVEREKP